MSYHTLAAEDIEEYVLGIDELKQYFGETQLVVSEIGDGNLNFVFLVKSVSDPDKSVVLKQAVPYLRCAGEDYLLVS